MQFQNWATQFFCDSDNQSNLDFLFQFVIVYQMLMICIKVQWYIKSYWNLLDVFLRYDDDNQKLNHYYGHKHLHPHN